jgi:hypothetical protein
MEFDFFHIADAAGKVMIEAMKNLYGQATLNGAKIRARLPTRSLRSLGVRRLRSIAQTKLAADLVVRGAFAAI